MPQLHADTSDPPSPSGEQPFRPRASSKIANNIYFSKVPVGHYEFFTSSTPSGLASTVSKRTKKDGLLVVMAVVLTHKIDNLSYQKGVGGMSSPTLHLGRSAHIQHWLVRFPTLKTFQLEFGPSYSSPGFPSIIHHASSNTKLPDVCAYYAIVSLAGA